MSETLDLLFQGKNWGMEKIKEQFKATGTAGTKSQASDFIY